MIVTGKSLVARINRTVLVLLAVIVLFIIGHFAIKALSIGIALAYFPFSGGSGRGLDWFMNQVFTPIVKFIAGAVAFGGGMAALSAVLTSNKLWLKSIAITGVIGGAITLMAPAIQQWLWQQDATIRELVDHTLKDESEKLELLAIDFAKHSEIIIKEVGGVSNVYLVGAELAKNGSVNYYDIGIDGTKTIYAIVEISKINGEPRFSLTCTTNLYIGQRDSNKHPCAQ